ncbi:MAG: hypothetical protein V4649_14185 [Bacteroidota bacterium]
MSAISQFGFLLLLLSVLSLVVAIPLLIFAGITGRKGLQKVSLRILLASGIMFLLSITFCSIGGINL